MPLAKVHVLEGRYDQTRLGKLSEATQNALIEVLGIPADDFQATLRAREGANEVSHREWDLSIPRDFM
jgi:hypothetical protein